VSYTNNEQFEKLFENDEEFQTLLWQKLADTELVNALHKIEFLEEEVRQLNEAINMFEGLILDQHSDIQNLFGLMRGAINAGSCLAGELDSVIKLNNLKFKEPLFEK
jgi:hypothetical protein